MRFFQDEADLTARFADRMAVVVPNMPIDWPDTKTTAAESGEWEGMFVRFRISRLADSKLVATEGDIKHYRNYGSVLMQVIGPVNEGPGRLLEVADKMGFIFAAWRQGGMLGRTPSAGPTVEEKSQQSLTVSVPYTSDFKATKEGTLLP